MAIIRSLTPGIQNVKAHESEVDCTFQVVEAPDGSRLLHLSTFGSEKRQSQPKVSQTIQLDREMAAQLVQVIKMTFPGI